MSVLMFVMLERGWEEEEAEGKLRKWPGPAFTPEH